LGIAHRCLVAGNAIRRSERIECLRRMFVHIAARSPSVEPAKADGKLAKIVAIGANGKFARASQCISGVQYQGRNVLVWVNHDE
jgi:hypothetical protein